MENFPSMTLFDDEMKMRTIKYIALFSILLPSIANAEFRTIALEINKGTNPAVTVTIYSEVQSEKRTNITVEAAADILRNAKGWGSLVGVAILTDGAGLRDYMPIIQAISDNAWLDLETIRPMQGMGEQILKHYGIEQAGPGYPPQSVGSPDP